MLNTVRFITAINSGGAEVTITGDNRGKIHADLIRPVHDDLFHPDAANTYGVVMFLFAGNFTGMAAGAPFLLNQ